MRSSKCLKLLKRRSRLKLMMWKRNFWRTKFSRFELDSFPSCSLLEITLWSWNTNRAAPPHCFPPPDFTFYFLSSYFVQFSIMTLSVTLYTTLLLWPNLLSCTYIICVSNNQILLIQILFLLFAGPSESSSSSVCLWFNGRLI